MGPLIDNATVEFVESGCALLVGTATSEGEPVAARGWGCRVLANGEPEVAGPLRLRVLLGEGDLEAVAHARVADQVAVTATSVRTLRSVQMKGTISAIEPATDDDAQVGEGYCRAFFTDIHETDGTPLEIVERLAPASYVAWVVEASEVYDQTPGPAAGVALLVDP